MTSSREILYGTTIGGSAYVLLRGQLRWLSENNWRVTLVTSPDERATQTSKREGVAVYPIPMKRNISLRADIRALWQWMQLIRKNRPDAINVGTPKAALLGGFASWLMGVDRRIYVVRGLRLEGTNGLFRALLWIMERLTSAFATDVIVVSRSLGRQYLHYKLVPAKKAWLIQQGSSNGVDADMIAAREAGINREDLRQDLGISPEKLVAGYIGRITRDKGVDTLIRAFAQNRIDPSIEILLIGNVDDIELIQQIQALGSRVHIVPWTDDLWGYLPAIDVLCLPTLREGFPNVVLEAAAAGIPAITTRATGAIDSVVDGQTGFLVDVGDEVALADRLNRLATDSSLRRRMGAAARERVRNEYQPEKIWQGILAILEQDYVNSGLTRLDNI